MPPGPPPWATAKIGILVNSSFDTIGGTTAGAGNLISGNTEDGVEIGGSGTSGTLVEGNYIGTDVTGTIAVGNLIAGVEIDAGASANTIGGSASSAASFVNLISGNGFAGVLIEGSGTEGNVVAGNWIGTTNSGDSALPDGTSAKYYTSYGTIGGGVVIEGGASGNRIGTDGAPGDSGERNIISGNDNDGVDLFGTGTSGNMVAGNWIGLGQNDTGLGNQGDGVYVVGRASGDTIGGTAAGAGNVIGGNYYGIQLDASSLVEGNLIGTNAAGTAAIPNQDAVEVGASDNTIGGTAAGAGNLLSGNNFEGIYIAAGVESILVQGNYIGTNATGTAALANGQEGIDDHGLNNTIGGTAIGAGNVISGNAAEGIYQAPGSARR